MPTRQGGIREGEEYQEVGGHGGPLTVWPALHVISYSIPLFLQTVLLHNRTDTENSIKHMWNIMNYPILNTPINYPSGQEIKPSYALVEVPSCALSQSYNPAST